MRHPVSTRGDLVTVAAKGPYTGKPRPALIVQTGESLPYRDSVTICLLTSDLIEAPLFRVRIEPGPANGLGRVSDVMVDKIVSVPQRAAICESDRPPRPGGHGARRRFVAVLVIPVAGENRGQTPI